MGDAQYYKHMRKYKSAWKVGKQEDGIFKIVGKYGVVAPYDLACTRLAVWLDYDGVKDEVKYKRKVRFINTKLDDLVGWDDVHIGLVGVFMPDSLDSVCKCIGAKKVRQYSQETLDKMRATAKANFSL
jgi:hypothetical protein